MDPGRNLPRALLGGLLLVPAIHVLTNAALLHVLSPAQISASPFPVAAAAQAAFGGASGRVVIAVALVSLVTILSATSLLAPRVLYGRGRDGLFPGVVTRVSRGGTPVTAMLLTGGAAVGLALAGTFDLLLALYALAALAVTDPLYRLTGRSPLVARPPVSPEVGS